MRWRSTGSSKTKRRVSLVPNNWSSWATKSLTDWWNPISEDYDYPENFHPPLPKGLKAHRWAIGLFSYYPDWILHFSDKVHPLGHKSFAFQKNVKAFLWHSKMSFKARLSSLSIQKCHGVAETDAADIAVCATLSPNLRSVAVFSRTLSRSERHRSSVGRKASIMVGVIRKWRQHLLGAHFRLVTDQKSAAFTLDSRKHGKINNDNPEVEKRNVSFDYIYRPSHDNVEADVLVSVWRLHSLEKLKELHNTVSSGCCPHASLCQKRKSSVFCRWCEIYHQWLSSQCQMQTRGL